MYFSSIEEQTGWFALTVSSLHGHGNMMPYHVYSEKQLIL